MANDDTTIITEGWKVHETQKAVLYKSIEGEAIWIPKSLITQIETDGTFTTDNDGKQVEGIDILIIPAWFAKKENLS